MIDETVVQRLQPYIEVMSEIQIFKLQIHDILQEILANILSKKNKSTKILEYKAVSTIFSTFNFVLPY